MVNEFYLSTKWKHARAAALRRDGYRCKLCARYGIIKQAEVVHHIVPLEDAPELAYRQSNLVSLCKACHNKQHSEKGGRRL